MFFVLDLNSADTCRSLPTPQGREKHHVEYQRPTGLLGAVIIQNAMQQAQMELPQAGRGKQLALSASGAEWWFFLAMDSYTSLRIKEFLTNVMGPGLDMCLVLGRVAHPSLSQTALC